MLSTHCFSPRWRRVSILRASKRGAEGVFSMNPMKLKLPSPLECGPLPRRSEGPGRMFRYSYGFIKFAKVRYFNHNQ